MQPYVDSSFDQRIYVFDAPLSTKTFRVSTISMALPHSHVVQEFPPEWNVTLDTETEQWNQHPHKDEKVATESIKAPSDNESTEKPRLDRVDTAATLSDEEIPLEIVGSTNIYDGDGKIRLIPVSNAEKAACHQKLRPGANNDVDTIS